MTLNANMVGQLSACFKIGTLNDVRERACLDFWV